MPAPADAKVPLAVELTELGTSSSSSEEELAGTVAGVAIPAGRRTRVALCAAIALVACGLLAGAGHFHRQRGPTAGAGTVGLGVLSAMADLLDSTGSTIKDTFKAKDDVVAAGGSVADVEDQVVGSENGLQNEFDGLGTHVEAHGPLVEALQNGSFQEWLQDPKNREKLKAMLKHHNSMHDGNFCEDDEEEHASLCYKKCSTLSKGEYPIRCSAFSCAKTAPCGFFNQHTHGLFPCTGYDIAGDSSNNACPHQRGACYADEELHLNDCYKKCALLTDGAYNWRSAAETCCKFKGTASCVGPGTTKTDIAFAVGGGEFEGDGNDAQGSIAPHPPMMSEAEKP